MAKREMTPLKGMFAFWAYSPWPPVLGSRAIAMDTEGYVEADGYGGLRFEPLKLLPEGEGIALNAKVRALEDARRREQKALDEKYRKAFAELLPFLPGSHHRRGR